MDMPVVRLRSVPGDPRKFERTAIHPERVVTGVAERNRPIRHNRVELLPCRLREELVAPATPGHPGGVFIRSPALRRHAGRRADQLERLLHTLGGREIAAQPFDTRKGGVNMRVHKPGQDRAAGRVDHAGVRAAPLEHSGIGANRNNAPCARGNGGVCGQHRTVEHSARYEAEVCEFSHGVSFLHVGEGSVHRGVKCVAVSDESENPDHDVSGVGAGVAHKL